VRPDQPSTHGAPRVPASLLSRPRLLAQLDTPAAVTVVRAPSGAGKTVLLTEWVHSPASPPCARLWLTLTHSTGERRAFWEAIIGVLRDAGLAPAGSEFGRSGDTPATSTDLRRMVGRYLAALPVDAHLILDDVHHVRDETIAADLIWLVQHVRNLRVVVATRTVSPFEHVANQARVDTFLLPARELGFTVEEISAVAHGAHLDRRLASVIHRDVGTNPLAVRAAILNMVELTRRAHDVLPDSTLVRMASEPLREMVIRSIEDQRMLDFAMRIAVADWVNVDLAARLSGEPDAGELLRLAEAFGLGIAGGGAGGGDASDARFQLTTVARSALRNELQLRHPDEITGLSGTLITWLLEHGHAFPAFRTAVEGGDLASAARVAREHFSALLSGYPGEVLHLLTPISKHELRGHPVLTLLTAVICRTNGVDRTRALEYFALTVVAARAGRRHADAAECALLFGIESTALRMSGRGHEALTAAEAFASAVDALTIDQREALSSVAPQLFGQVGMSFLYGERHDEASEFFERAYAAAGTASEYSNTALSLVAGALAAAGEMVEVSRLVDELASARRRSGSRAGDTDDTDSFFHLAGAFLALEAFDFDRVAAHVEALAPRLETLEHWPLFASVDAMADLGRGRAHHADLILKRELARGRRLSITASTRHRLDVTRSVLLLASGRADEANAVLARLPDVPQVAVARARTALIIGEPEAAAAEIAALDLDALTPRLTAEAKLLRAAAELRLGFADAARATAEKAAALMLHRGLRHPLMLTPYDDRVELAAMTSPAASELLTDPAIPDVLPARLSVFALTERELLVLRHLAGTKSAAEIAAELFVSVNTLKTHIRSLYRKLNVASRKHALTVAAEHGLLTAGRRGTAHGGRGEGTVA